MNFKFDIHPCNEDYVESIKWLMKIFFYHVIHYFGLFFLRVIDLKWFQVPQRHVGHPHGRRQRGLCGVHQVVNENIFCHVVHYFGLVLEGKSFKNDFKYLRDMLDSGHPHRPRQRGVGGVHQVVDENIL